MHAIFAYDEAVVIKMQATGVLMRVMIQRII
jgi:hypothetical protein